MPDFSAQALAILRILRDRHNVLVSGPPGTGKSRLLNEVARAFEATEGPGPIHVPGAVVAIPSVPPVAAHPEQFLPSPERTNRKVFRTVFHQNSKYREFLTGLAPVIGSQAAAGGTSFRVVAGTLYRASEHARAADGAALLIIDEINRGPAVQVFGGSIVAIESDKRLAPDGSPTGDTNFFEISEPITGDPIEYALPHHLYILGAMNQADTSVEPLDVAFLRRWTPFRLDPDRAVLRAHFQLPSAAGETLPDSPTTPGDVYEAATRAWSGVNDRIRLGRGQEFQVGHGVLMARTAPATSVEGALQDVAESWRLIRAHVDEVFFGDLRGVAAVLNVGVSENHPYTLTDSSFADEPRLELIGPDNLTLADTYKLLRAVAGETR